MISPSLRLLFFLLVTSTAAGQQRVLMLVGEREYGSERTMPALAEELERSLDGVEVEVRLAPGREMPSLDELESFDMVLLYLRFREATDEQRARLAAYVAEHPSLALRTTSHGFWGDPGWFPPLYGGHYKAHAPNSLGTRVVPRRGGTYDALIAEFPAELELEHGGTYDAQPLADGAEVILFGRTGDLPAQPVAWGLPGKRRLYTSLGSESDFQQAAFRAFVVRAVEHGLGRLAEAPPVAVTAAPSPPPLESPSGATVLFDGSSLEGWRHWDPSLAPRAIHIDGRADSSSGGEDYDGARWLLDPERGVVTARPGFGDLVLRAPLGDVLLHLDFRLPVEAERPLDFLGSGGIFLGDRYELNLSSSSGAEPGEWSLGALTRNAPPLVDAARPAGEWQSLSIQFSHRFGAPARVSAWLNGVRIQHDLQLDERSPYGSLASLPRPSGARHVASDEESKLCSWGEEPFTWVARFRSTGEGTLVSKCNPEGEWVPDGKALFLRGGHLVYDIGWVGELRSEGRFADGAWHTVALCARDGGEIEMFVDGELEGEIDDFQAPDHAEFRLKIGEAGSDFGGTFDGELERLEYWAAPLSSEDLQRLSRGEGVGSEPAWRASRAALSKAPLRTPDTELPWHLRLQADASEVEFANIWAEPLGEVDHAGLIESWDGDALVRGEAVYQSLCIACHGADGLRTANPKARAFAAAPLQNGADPLSLFRTVSSGYGEMPASDWLRPDQRYDVIHYVRETFLREQNPSQYTEVTPAYLAGLPRGRVGRPRPEDLVLEPRDFGGALASQLGTSVGACLSVALDDRTTIAYDTQVMASPGAWTGGFLDLAETQHYKQRGEGHAEPGGETLTGLDSWAWGYGGTLAWPRERRPERGPLPPELLDYRGYHATEAGTVLEYSIDGRSVLEHPSVERGAGFPVIVHQLRIAAGDAPLVLQAAAGQGWGGAFGTRAGTEGPGGWRMTYQLVGGEDEGALAVGLVPLSGCATPADLDLGRYGAGGVLALPARDAPMELLVLRAALTSTAQLAGFEALLAGYADRPAPTPLDDRLGGGPTRWPEVLASSGRLGSADRPYALDTLSLPESNPWNAWLRTSALDFFDDGRAVVTTLGGDVWLVSGIDETLQQLRWKRFAAGLFEPLGCKVVEGQVLVTCRDRIVRLHDRNGDEEADFYESFFADPDVSPYFHSFNFDLQQGPGGELYYAKAGQYTAYALPGAILEVQPDGRAYEVYSTGLRTPNGMGMSPDGRPLVSDNQGNWVPASKVTLSDRGGFHGVFKAIEVNRPGKQTRDDFDRPALWLPQAYDSSSGGQLWVDDPRFGPLAGRYLHTSFGKGWMFAMQIDPEVPEGVAWRLPFQFHSGIQRARVNPADGQVYAVGLSGWQGPVGGADGGLQRVRYTGTDGTLLRSARITDEGVRLEFSGPLAEAPGSVTAKRWNYAWSSDYGSAHYSLASPGEEGEDEVRVRALRASDDRRALDVVFEEQLPCDTLELRLDLETAGGQGLTHAVLATVNRGR